MKLQGRNLELNLRGEDVTVLRAELSQLDLETLIVDPDGFFGSTTFLAVQRFQGQHNLPVTGVVDERTAAQINRAVDALERDTYVVKGRVLRPDGDPVLRARVRVLEKHLRNETILGEGRTNPSGRYEITYPIPENGALSLIVRLLDQRGNELAASAVICNARPVETVDLIVGRAPFRGPSEFKHLQTTVSPPLGSERIQPADLTESDVNLLACQEDVNEEHLAFFVVSARLARETDLPSEWFYALLRQGLPTALIALVAQPTEVLAQALEASVRENIVGQNIRQAIPEILRSLQQQIVRLALRDSEPDRPTLGALLDIANVREELKQRIVGDYVEHKGPVEEFWRKLRRRSGVNSRTVNSIQDVIRLATVTLNHEPLVRLLMELRAEGELGSDLRALARFKRRDWETLLEREVGGRRVGAPAVLAGEEAERPARFAAFLERMVEAIFPTTVLAYRLAELDDSTFESTIAFLERNPEFDFTTMRLHDYLRDHSNAIERDVETTTRQLEAVQRMMNIAPPFNKVSVVQLISEGIDSALSVRRMGAPQFLRTQGHQFESGLEAEQFYSNAARHADTTLMVLSQSVVFNPTDLAITAPHLFGEGVPDLEALFGSLDLCQCHHCSSVYSPSAYLVDILHFLMNRPTVTGNRTALDVLLGDPDDPARRRRGDIAHIELTCQNTETVLPYVDLVNEILERVVAPGPEGSFQTGGEAATLAANPEHLNESAYNVLAQAVYPWSLPFALWASEARTYLGQLGITRSDLMESFGPPGGPPLEIDVAAEYLGLTPRERAVVNASAPESTREMWGMETAEFNRLLSTRRASTVVERSGLSYEELVSVLGVRIVNPTGVLRIEFSGADCDLLTATITGLGATSLGRMHRFVRLQRKLGWPIGELDRILRALGANNLSDEVLLQLARIKRVREALKPSWETMLTWWSPRIETQGRNGKPSLYERIFSDPTINPPSVDIFSLNNSGTELDQTDLLIADHLSEVSSALGVSVDDVVQLAAAELSNDRLRLINLSRLYRAVTFAQSLSLSIPQYLQLRALSGIDPLGPGRLSQTEEFVNQTREVRESGIELRVLDYLIRHRTSASQALWTESQIAVFLTGLRAALQQAAAEWPFEHDPGGQRTADTLAMVLSSDLLDRVLALLNNQSTEDQLAQTGLINDHLSLFLDPAEAVQRLVNPGTLASPEERFDYVLGHLLNHLIRQEHENLVVENLATAIGVTPEVSDSLVRRLVPAPNDPEMTSLEVFLLPTFLSVTPDEPTATFPIQSQAFHRLAKIGIVLNALSVPAQYVEYLLVSGPTKGWVDPMSLPLDIQDSAGDLLERWLDQIALFRAALALTGGVVALFELLVLVDQPDLTHGDLLDLVAESTGWNRPDLDFLTGAEGLAFSFPSDYSAGDFLIRLRDCFSLLAIIGASAQEVTRWAAPNVSSHIARSIKQAVRARFPDQAQWLGVAQPMRDTLREQQRAALVDYLVQQIRIELPLMSATHPVLVFNPTQPESGRPVLELQMKLNASGVLSRQIRVTGFFDGPTFQALQEFQLALNLPPNGTATPATWAALDEVRQRLGGPEDLYAHFLVDVEMDPCMLTSRIVLATNSVQLFVQRCLLNLEPEVELTPEDAKEWSWMSRYRLWEANRKVFLYPENWVEPELRDDKTQFFRQLESGLLQDEVNEETVEREYLRYLESLDAVGQVEISGLYREWDVDRDILHVVGRTRNKPHVYYYRRHVNRRYWTAWEKIDVEIEGDHLVPVVWNRSLHLFWPIFLERADEEVTQPVAQLPTRYFEIRMACSQLRDGKWTAKQVSEEFVETKKHLAGEKHDFSFWSYFTDAGSIVFAGEQPYTVGLSNQLAVFLISPAGHISTWAPDSDEFKELRPFPNTLPYFNGLREYVPEGIAAVDMPPAPFQALTGGLQNDHPDQATVLNQTPGVFRILFPQDERPFTCRSPFFFVDDTRSFLVVPSGGYSGGYGPGDLNEKLNPTDGGVPLELPDSVVRRVRSLVGGVPSGAETGERVGGQAVEGTRIGLIMRTNEQVHAALPMSWQTKFFDFHNFYHPYVRFLVEQLNRQGIEGILHPDPQKEPDSNRRELVDGLRRQRLSAAFFNATYEPNESNVLNVLDLTDEEKSTAGPLDEFDFSSDGAYSVYNWELFFHAPLLIAKRLRTNQRFAEAQRWLNYIFDPTYKTSASGEFWPMRVWQIKPFFEHGLGKSIERAMSLLRQSGLSKQELAERGRLRDEIEEWRNNPYNPHLIARLRPEAYMKTVVMAYLDTLIAWGDHLFREDTRESINEASQLYLLANEILGDRPRDISAHEGARRTVDGEEVNTFDQLRNHLDAFSNALVDLETVVFPANTDTGSGGSIGSLLGATGLTLGTGPDDGPTHGTSLVAAATGPPDDGVIVLDLPLAAPVPAILGPSLFFCIPKNDKLLQYWDTVADRLFKIRHCMNIEGVERQLALFAPPIDPALLVQAAAAGIDIGSVLSDLNAPSPIYRFQVLVQKANELVNDVKSLGSALLAALEKKDGEELAVLRSSQEVQVLSAVREVKLQQVDDAGKSKEAMELSRAVSESRKQHFQSLEKKSGKEQQHSDNIEDANQYQKRSSTTETLRAAFGYLPDFDIGVEGWASTPTVKGRWGSSNLLSYMSAISQSFAFEASQLTHSATKALAEAGYDRRQEDWDFQAGQAEGDIAQIDKQVAAAALRIQIAEQDLSSHDIQVENAKSVDAYMRNKYSNQELYSWMASQLTSVYAQSYQLAFDLAKRAERAFRSELGLQDSSYIRFDSWDSQKGGLLAGERLQHDLRRLEVAYLEQNRREYEVTKHISIGQLDPLALLRLKETGECLISLPEILFDLDYPGHYLRRIKRVSITVPCITGPYTSVSCTLTLLRSSIRSNTTLLNGTYERDLQNDDSRFVDSLGAVQSIVTSSGQNDGGMFETNLRDERYLPFEGMGGISEWRVELPHAFHQFDYDTISDVILHVHYTARDGGGQLRQQATAEARAALNAIAHAQGLPGLGRLFSLRRDFPNAFHRLLHSPADQPQATSFDLGRQHFPFFLRDSDLELSRVALYLKPVDNESIDPTGLLLNVNGVAVDGAWSQMPDTTLMESTVSISGSPIRTWSFDAGIDGLDLNVLDDIWILIGFEIHEPQA